MSLPPLDPSPVFLVGFMATGKTTVGRLVAAALGRRFVDLDEAIEARAARSIPELWQAQGEAAFRRLEAEVLAVELDGRGTVVACGGGTPCFGDNLTRMRRSGVVVALAASLETLLARVAPGQTGRPLMASADAAAALYAERAAIYGRADTTVATDGLDVDAVAAEVVRRISLRVGHVAVRLDERSYPIHLAGLETLGQAAHELLGQRTMVAIVTDDNVALAGHALRARASLDAAGLPGPIVSIPPGEPSKKLAQVERVCELLAQAGLDRRSAIVAVGGGVVGDLAGFVAATLFRGVPVVQVPTTLLAMVDSAIGGKTGVDLPSGKNLVGAFWQPRFVLADVATLATLPARERRAALAEVLKVGLLADPELVRRLETHGEAVDTVDAVWRCARMKAGVVSDDEHERKGTRILLNLGHTVGHAIEAFSGRLVHGECVGLGLVAAARVSERLGVAPKGLEARVAAAVVRVGLDADLGPWLGDDVLAFLATDKKRVGGLLTLVALEDVGKPKTVTLAPGELTRLLRSA